MREVYKREGVIMVKICKHLSPILKALENENQIKEISEGWSKA
jgi:hypothetical protein